jgi:hypothetical protein
LLRSWLRPHRGLSHDKLPLYLGFFQVVHNARRRGKALLHPRCGPRRLTDAYPKPGLGPPWSASTLAQLVVRTASRLRRLQSGDARRSRPGRRSALHKHRLLVLRCDRQKELTRSSNLLLCWVQLFRTGRFQCRIEPSGSSGTGGCNLTRKFSAPRFSVGRGKSRRREPADRLLMVACRVLARCITASCAKSEPAAGHGSGWFVRRI